MKTLWPNIAEIAIILALGAFTVYVNAQKVPVLEEKIQSHEVKISVIEAHYTDILKTLERIERRINK